MTKFGHIGLGHPGDIREYVLTDPNAYAKVLVNPMAAKISQGAGAYDSYDGMAYWLQENWSLGVGVEPPEPNGFRYGEIDSRYENRLMLLPRTWPTSLSDNLTGTSWNHPGNYEYEYIVGDEGRFEQIAIPLGAFTGTLNELWVYFKNDTYLITAGAEIWTGASEPTTKVQDVTLASDGATLRSGYRHGSVSPPVVGNGVDVYWIVIGSTTAVTIPAASGDFLATQLPLIWSEGAWIPSVGETGREFRAFFLTDLDTLPAICCGNTFNGQWYVGCIDGTVYKRTGVGEGNEVYALVGTVGAPIIDMIEWWGKLIIITDGTFAQAMDTGEAFSALSFVAQAALVHRGFFWYATDNEAFYDVTENLDTPSPAIVVGPGNYKIRGLAGNANNLIASTDEALWFISAGDFVFGLTKWDYPDPNHGVGMKEREGLTYIPYGNALMRYAENAPISNIWIRDTPLPPARQGELISVVSTNKELILLVDSEGQSTAWSWNNQGWHCLAAFPISMNVLSAEYDYSSRRLYFMMAEGYTFWIPASLPDNLPTQDKLAVFEPDSWLDTGDYFAQLYAVMKDIDSVQIVGENISPERPVAIYWRDDDSVEDDYLLWADGTQALWADGDTWGVSSDNWQFLGTVTTSGQMIRWDDPATRPETLGIRLGILLQTRNQLETPVVRAIVLRHRPMLGDRYQHQLPISLAHDGAGIDGRTENRLVQDMMIHLDSLVGSVSPVIFIDPWGIEREVSVSHATLRPNGYKVSADKTTTHIDVVFSVTVEELIEGVYTRPEVPDVPDIEEPSPSDDYVFDFEDSNESQFVPGSVPFM